MKSAAALARQRVLVEVLGAWSDPVLKARDEALVSSLPFKFTPVMDLTVNKLPQLSRRIRTKTGRIAQQFLNVENRWQLGYCLPELRKATFRRNAELYIAHSEQAMAVAVDLLRNGRRVGVDMEDWFSEDLLPNARRHRPLRLLRSMENELLVNCAYASCPSIAMSMALGKANSCRSPTVIYNVFEWAERQRIDGAKRDRQESGLPSIHWYSQTIGPGRGLEDLLAALPLLNNEVEIHLRGQLTADFEAWLRAQVSKKWQKKIFLHRLVTNAELLSRVAEHDIGFAGEINYCRSRDLTITNKIFHYLLAGLAVVASDTAGQKEVANHASNAVLLYPSGNSATLAARLNLLLGSPELLRSAKADALRAAEETFCWERQERSLLNAVAQALHNNDVLSGSQD